MATTAINKDLPDSSGEIAEWPQFFQTLKNTTKLCGFTNAENMARLHKCLKGRVLEAARALLIRDYVG